MSTTIETTSLAVQEPSAVATKGSQGKAEVLLDDAGLFRPRSLEEAFRVATAYHRSGLLPKRFESPEMVLTAMQFALELGLKPLTALRQIAVVNGTPSVFGDLPLSMVLASGKLTSMDEYLFTKDGTRISPKSGNMGAEVWGAYFCATRKGDPEPVESFFTMADAQKAGLQNSPTWKAYPQRMLRYRARSAGLKDKFPDCLNGIAIAEYDFNVIPDDHATAQLIEAAPAKSPATDLNARFGVAPALDAGPPAPAPSPPVDRRRILEAALHHRKVPPTDWPFLITTLGDRADTELRGIVDAYYAAKEAPR